MQVSSPQPALTRPYFFPPTVDFEALPAAVQTAIAEIVVPAYEELVVGAESAIERSAGTSLVLLLALEIMEQMEIGAAMDFAAEVDDIGRGKRDKQIAA